MAPVCLVLQFACQQWVYGRARWSILSILQNCRSKLLLETWEGQQKRGPCNLQHALAHAEVYIIPFWRHLVCLCSCIFRCSIAQLSCGDESPRSPSVVFFLKSAGRFQPWNLQLKSTKRSLSKLKSRSNYSLSERIVEDSSFDTWGLIARPVYHHIEIHIEVGKCYWWKGGLEECRHFSHILVSKFFKGPQGAKDTCWPQFYEGFCIHCNLPKERQRSLQECWLGFGHQRIQQGRQPQYKAQSVCIEVLQNCWKSFPGPSQGYQFGQQAASLLFKQSCLLVVEGRK